MFIRSPEDLAVAVKMQRKHKKLSQAAAGELVGLKQATISAFENNPKATQLDTLFRLLAALDLDITINVRGSISPEQMQWKEEW